MPKKTSPLAPGPILREAWAYLRKQPVLVTVTAWFLFLPAVADAWIGRWWDAQGTSATAAVLQPLDVLLLFAVVAIGFLELWGVACVLLVGKRMILNRAGRTRSSFRRVRADALPLLWPLLLTSLLQQCFVFYRALLYVIPAILVILLLGRNPAAHLLLFALTPLLLPAILYALRTSFAPIILACEGKAYREALRRSRDITKWSFLRIVGTMFALAVATLLPAFLLSSFLWALLAGTPVQFSYIGDVTDSLLFSAAILFLSLSIIALYGKVKIARGGPTRVEP